MISKTEYLRILCDKIESLDEVLDCRIVGSALTEEDESRLNFRSITKAHVLIRYIGSTSERSGGSQRTRNVLVDDCQFQIFVAGASLSKDFGYSEVAEKATTAIKNVVVKTLDATEGTLPVTNLKDQQIPESLSNKKNNYSMYSISWNKVIQI